MRYSQNIIAAEKVRHAIRCDQEQATTQYVSISAVSGTIAESKLSKLKAKTHHINQVFLQER